MYKEFYGFSEDPFNLTPDPGFLFSPSGYEALRFSIESGIQERKGVMVITGEVGTGKTTLINALLKELDEKIKTAFIFNPKLTFKELLKTVLWELKIPVAGESTSSLIKKLNQFLTERMAEGENVLVIIDEAQNLAGKVLKNLHQLYQRVPPGVYSLQTLLVGQVELETKLNSEELRPFRDLVALQKQIRLLSVQESKQYIDHRLRLVGSCSSKVFTPEAVEVICEYAKGIPRVINLICDGALFAGYEASAPLVDAQMARKAIAENEITVEKNPFPRKKAASGRRKGAEKARAEEKGDSIAGPIISGNGSLTEKDKITGKEIPGEKKGVTQKETSIGAKAGVMESLGFREEEAGGRGAPRSQEEIGSRRAWPLLRVAILALLLGFLAVFYSLYRPDILVSPLLPEEEPTIPSLDQRPIDEEEKRSVEGKKTLKVEEGWNLSILSKISYGSVNPSFIDLILEANPQITDLNRLQVGNSLEIPEISEKLLLRGAGHGNLKIHLGTFADRDQARGFRDVPVLQGKTLEMVPRKVSSRETWYQLFAGPFENEEEALESIQALKQRGLLPFFPSLRKTS
ncbi:MAG: AAA family ATPase [Syntrophaceae bacterium]|nr:AAA family ATPase [Syntrophaceae bacterium]